MHKSIENNESLKSYYGQRHYTYLKNWQQSRAGISEKVPPPWKSVRVEDKTAIVWGRRYVFNDLFLPVRIINQDNEILAAPIELILRVGGKTVNLHSEIKILEQKPAKAIFQYKMENEELLLSADVEVEYDGMLKTCLNFIPKAEINIEEFTVKMLLRKELAELYHFYPGKWGTAYNSAKLPESGLKLGFKPYIWLGNKEMGVSFFTETDENWHNHDKSEAISVSMTDKAAELTIKIIDRDYKLKNKTKYIFGIQATPVKPFPKDWHKYHFAHVCYYGMDKQIWKGSGQISLKYPGAGNVNPDQGTIDFHVCLMFDPQKEIELPSHRPDQELALRRIFRGIYARKLMTLYLDNESFLALYWYVPKKCFRVYLTLKSEGREGSGRAFALILDAPVKWKKNEWHHLGLSYGRKIKVYADNKLLAETLAPAEIKQLSDYANMQLQFGGHEGCDFAIADIRTGKTEIDHHEIQKGILVDHDSLLLDCLDSVTESEGKYFTKPKKIVNGLGGEITGEIKLIDSNGRKGMLLCEDRPARTTLEYLKDSGVNVLVFHEHWANIQNYPDFYHRKDIRKIAKFCHSNKIKLLLYFGYEISNINPEWEKYHEECLCKFPGEAPDRGWRRNPEQTAYGVCYNSIWQNFMAYSIEKAMKDFNIDGVYLDGTIHPFACRNYLHGCGYKTAKNEYKPVYQIFAVRDLMKRIYNICVGEHHGLVSAHNSTCVVMPTVGFVTSCWNGEQFNVPLKGEPLAVLPLETFQAEFMGRNHGVPAEFLTYAPFVWTVEEALAFTLIHDVLIRPINVGATLNAMSKIWKIQDNFDCDGSEWFPYYRKQELAEIAGDKIKVSYFLNRKSGIILLIAANLDKNTCQAKIRINPRLFGKDICSTKEVFPTETEIETKNNTIEFSLSKLSVKQMLIK